MAATVPYVRSRGPRAASRCGFRVASCLPSQPLGVEVLAAIAHARAHAGRQHEWDARLESSAIAVCTYLWRRGRGERWAGVGGSARYGCSLAQLVMGLAPIMGWTKIPNPRDQVAVRAFVRAHRKSVQRWLDWLAAAGLVTHIPQQDAEGFWWRTIITLHPCPELPAQILADAAERRAGWGAREARRRARGRRRDLTAILQAARLTAAQRRSRGIARRAELARYAERQRVRQKILDSLKTHLTHPCGASATPQYPETLSSSEEDGDRGIARAETSAWDLLRPGDETRKSRIEQARPWRALDP